MEQITKDDIKSCAKTYINTEGISPLSVTGIAMWKAFIAGAEMILEINGQLKPHVAKVVKCGDVNKSKAVIDQFPWNNPIPPDPTCKHENGPLVFSQGYTCIKCNGWITYPKIERLQNEKSSI